VKRLWEILLFFTQFGFIMLTYLLSFPCSLFPFTD
jgi:hypothetical protein